MSGIPNDVKDSFFQNLKDRLNDPLLGTFSITFIIYNYIDFLLLIFDTPPVRDRIETFKQGISDWHSIFLPLAISSFYIFLYPFIKKLIVGFAEARKLDIIRKIDEKKNENIRKYKEFQEIEKKWDLKKKILESEIWYYKKEYLENYKKTFEKYTGNIIIEPVKYPIEPGRWVTRDHMNNLIEAKSPVRFVTGIVLECFQSSDERDGATYDFAIVLTSGKIDQYNFYNLTFLQQLDYAVLYLSEIEPGSLTLETDLKLSKKNPLCTYEKKDNILWIHPGQPQAPEKE